MHDKYHAKLRTADMRLFTFVFTFGVFTFSNACASTSFPPEIVKSAIDEGCTKESLSFLQTQPPEQVINPSNGVTALHYAVSTQDVDCVKKVYRALGGLNAQNKNGDTPLILAARLNERAFNYLISEGAEMNIVNKQGFGFKEFRRSRLLREIIPFTCTASLMNDFINLPERQRIDPITKKTPLHHAVIEGDLSCVKTVHYLFGGENTKDARGLTPIDYAIDEKNLKKVKFLIAHGAVVSKSDKQNSVVNEAKKSLRQTKQTASQQLENAMASGCKEETLSKIKHDGRLELGENQLTPLMYAAMHYDLACMKRVLKYFGGINQETENGATALMITGMTLAKEKSSFLISKGANPNKKTKLGFSFAHVAVSLGISVEIHGKCREEILKDLAKNPSEYFIDPIGGSSPLLTASWNSDIDCFKRVHKLFGGINYADSIGHTPLIQAAYMNDKERIEYLIKHGADTTYVTPRGHSYIDAMNSVEERRLKQTKDKQ